MSPLQASIFPVCILVSESEIAELINTIIDSTPLVFRLAFNWVQATINTASH
jgi:hypothetical protein